MGILSSALRIGIVVTALLSFNYAAANSAYTTMSRIDRQLERGYAFQPKIKEGTAERPCEVEFPKITLRDADCNGSIDGIIYRMPSFWPHHLGLSPHTAEMADRIYNTLYPKR